MESARSAANRGIDAISGAGSCRVAMWLLDVRPGPSPEHDRAADALVEALGDPLDPLGGGIERGRDRRLGGLAAVGGDDARLLQTAELGFEPADVLLGLAEFVADGQGRHDQEPIVADFPKTAAQLLDLTVEFTGQSLEMALLPVLAGHTILATIDGDGHMRTDDLSRRDKRPGLDLEVVAVTGHGFEWPSGWCRWRRRADGRLPDSCFRARAHAQLEHRDRPQAVSDPCRVPGAGF